MRNTSMLDGIKIAHKGLHNADKGVFENSVLACEIAANEGFPIEIDVHLTKDGKIVVTHDDFIDIDGIKRKIKDLNYDEIASEKVPLLTDVLKAVAGRVLTVIEIKTYYNVGPLEKVLLEVLENYEGTVAVQSFNPFCLAWFKKNKPEYLRGLLSSDFRFRKYNLIERVFLKNLCFAKAGAPDFVAYDIVALNDKVAKKIRRLGAKVIGWTIDDAEKLAKAGELCDGIIFENLTDV